MSLRCEWPFRSPDIATYVAFGACQELQSFVYLQGDGSHWIRLLPFMNRCLYRIFLNYFLMCTLRFYFFNLVFPISINAELYSHLWYLRVCVVWITSQVSVTFYNFASFVACSLPFILDLLFFVFHFFFLPFFFLIHVLNNLAHKEIILHCFVYSKCLKRNLFFHPKYSLTCLNLCISIQLIFCPGILIVSGKFP